MSKTFEQLEQLVIEWAGEKGILEQSSFEKQFLKTVEELGELSKAMQKDCIEEIKLELGDVIVTMILLAHFNGHLLSDYNLDLYPFAGENLVGLCETALDYAVWQQWYKLHPFLCEASSLANYYGSSLEQCLELAYNKISTRKGAMAGGLFVKEAA